ncbi:MAG: two-component regulator propeller domain-containing protein [Bacteroidia bacterium]
MRWLVVLWIVFNIFRVAGQDPLIHADAFYRESGLSDNWITAIVQDDKGILWISTKQGLNSYDGTVFTQYFQHATQESANTDVIYDMILLPDNKLALATRGGLSIFDIHSKKFSVIPVNRKISHMYPIDNMATSVRLDSANRLWLGTYTGIHVFDQCLNPVHSFFAPESQFQATRLPFVNRLFTASDHTIIFESYVLESLWAKVDFDCDTVLPISSQLPESAFFSQIFNLTRTDAEGNFWTFSKSVKVLQSYFPKTHQTQTYAYNPPPGLESGEVLNFLPLSDHQVLFWYTNHSLALMNTDNGKMALLPWQLSKYAEVQQSPLQSIRDYQGNLWLWGEGTGLYEICFARQVFQQVPELTQYLKKFATTPITGYLEQGDYIFLSTFGKGIIRYDLTSGKINHIIFPDSTLFYNQNEVWNIKQHNGDTLWVGTSHGMLWLDKHHLTWGPHANPLLRKYIPITQFTDSYNLVWIGLGGGNGVMKYDPKNNSYFHYPSTGSKAVLPIRHPYTIAEDEAGNLWMATQRGGGLVKWDRNGDCFSLIHPYEIPGFTNDLITVLVADKKGGIWISASGQGLVKYNIRENTCESFGRADGLSHTQIDGITLDDQGILWLATSYGLNRFDPVSKSVKVFLTPSGLPDNEVSSVSVIPNSNGEIFVGFKGAYARFHSDNIKKNIFVPPVFIEGMLVNGEPISDNSDEVLQLPPDQNHIQFNFTALNFINGPANQYACYLEGAETRWKNLGPTRFALYANLPPGHYWFHVKAANNDGVWNETGCTREFVILPEWWATRWFRTAILLTFFSVVWGIFSWRRFQEKQIEELRNRIAGDLHDDIGSTMLSIRLYSEAARRSVAVNRPDLIPLFERIGGTVQNIMENMRDIIWSIDARYDSLQDLSVRIKEHTEKVTELAGIASNYHFSGTFQTLNLDPERKRNIFLIFKESLHNAVRYSQCHKIDIYLNLKGSEIELIVADDGKGFWLEEITPGNGLKNMQRRAAEIKGKLNIQSSPGKGTQIQLIWKKKRKWKN